MRDAISGCSATSPAGCPPPAMTDAPATSHALLYAAIAILICWRLFRRVRRLIGRQPVRTRSLTVTAVLFVLLIVVLASTSMRSVALIGALAAGAAVGLGLGLLGLKLTRFEKTEAGCFYVPNTILGVAVSLLFIGRLIYRFASIYFMSRRRSRPRRDRGLSTRVR